jgi:hypothetical protein
MTYTSTAISAQGSTLEMGTGTGGAVTCTAGAAGYPTILTKSSHGLTNGTVVTLAAFTGVDAATLNGQVCVVQEVTTNTFAVKVDTTGKTITYTGTATPVTYTKIKNLKSYSGFDGQAGELDATHLESAAKEFVAGLKDAGSFTIDYDIKISDTGQAALQAAQLSGLTKTFKLTLPDAAVASFSAFVKKIPIAGGVDQIVKASGVTLRITGDVTWA